MQATALMFEMARVAEDAFDQVVRHREAQLLRIAYRITGNWADAEDVAQEVFMRLHRHGLDFPNEAALGAWLYRVTVNLCVDKSRHARPTTELPELGSEDPSVEAELLREERNTLLMIALGTLPAKERAAVVLREIEGLATAEVAEILGSSEVTVRGQVSKAMASSDAAGRQVQPVGASRNQGTPGVGAVDMGNRLEAARVSMRQLVSPLSNVLGRPVVERTGITATFDVHLDWTPDVGNTLPPDESGPSIFTAMQEQFGLRLEPQKGPVEVLVIDSADKPSEN